jgi:uncharacterized membrane protein
VGISASCRCHMDIVEKEIVSLVEEIFSGNRVVAGRNPYILGVVASATQCLSDTGGAGIAGTIIPDRPSVIIDYSQVNRPVSGGRQAGFFHCFHVGGMGMAHARHVFG